jgi:hypothetical protein
MRCSIGMILLATSLALSTATFSGPPVLAASDDIHFGAELTPDEETMVVSSAGAGHADVWLERANLKITWRVTFKGLAKPPISVGMYGPATAGANAGLQLDLGAQGLASPVGGSTILSDGQFQYLITSKMFVNVLTRSFPKGELRGQLERTRETPKAPS